MFDWLGTTDYSSGKKSSINNIMIDLKYFLDQSIQYIYYNISPKNFQPKDIKKMIK